MNEKAPYYHLVPKQLEANLLYRQELLDRARDDDRLKAALVSMCAKNPLFWINAFGWVYDADTPADAPFITYDFQDDAVLSMSDAIGRYDLLIEKSRKQGATWMGVYTLLHRWQFSQQMYKFILTSRVERKIDRTDDPDSLFWKWDYGLRKQPAWLRPRQKHGTDRTYLKSLNPITGSVVTGEPTTADIGLSGRAAAILHDEYGAVSDKDSFDAEFSTQFVTKCRIWISTARGPTGAFYEKTRDQNVRKITIHWSQNPTQNPGLYKAAQDGSVEILDEPWHKAHPGYRFTREPGGWKGLRSPWYDAECDRTRIKALIAQELDINYHAAISRFFDAQKVADHVRDYSMAPFSAGELDFDTETAQPLKFVPNMGKKRLRLWCHLLANGKPPASRRYGVGVDVSAGTGATNSCISVGDARTGEKVGAFAAPDVSPDQMARYAAAVGYWFEDAEGNPAQIICESNGGINQQFLKTLLGLGYPSVYYKRDEARLAGKVSDAPGWGSTPDTKRFLLEEYARALSVGEFINRDEESLDECQDYVYSQSGQVEHARINSAADPSGAGANHGDRVIADALCWHIIKMWRGPVKEQEVEPAYNSAAWRYKQARLEQQRVDYW